MAKIIYASRELQLRIVYTGPGVSGKTTNLQSLYRLAGDRALGAVKDMPTVGTDRTLFFDLLPMAGGTWQDLTVKDKCYTVPGQVFYKNLQGQVLRDVDAIVFVADSRPQRLEANLVSMRDLYTLMAAQIPSRPLHPAFPLVMQYNYRDAADALSIEVLEQALNPWGFPSVEAVAIAGTGVEETFALAHAAGLAAFEATR